MHDDWDKELEVLFRKSDAELPDEPFLAKTAERLRSTRLSRAAGRWALRVLAIAAAAAASPWLIDASIRLSAALEYVFGEADAFLETPVGMAIAVLCVLPVILRFRKRLL